MDDFSFTKQDQVVGHLIQTISYCANQHPDTLNWKGLNLAKSSYLVYVPEQRIYWVHVTGREGKPYPIDWSLYADSIYLSLPNQKNLYINSKWNYPIENTSSVAVVIPQLKAPANEKSFISSLNPFTTLFPSEESYRSDMNQQVHSTRIWLKIVNDNALQWMKSNKPTLKELPTLSYPVSNPDNLALATKEMDALWDAYLAYMKEDTTAVWSSMQDFVLYRNQRWRDNDSYLPNYEQMEEVRLGMPYAYALSQFDSLMQDINVSDSLREYWHTTEYFDHLSSSEVLLQDIARLYNGNLLSADRLLQDRLRTSGAILAILTNAMHLPWQDLWKSDYANLNWFRVWSDTLHVNRKILDSLYQYQMECVSQLQADSAIQQQYTMYQKANEQFQKQSGYHIVANWQEKTESQLQAIHYVIAPETQSVLSTRFENLQMQNEYVNISLQHRCASYQKYKTGYQFATCIKEFDSFVINNTEIEKIGNIDAQFDSLFFNADDFKCSIRHKGILHINQDSILINLTPTLHYQVEEEYREGLESLNAKLIAQGVPSNWLADLVNSENFKIHYNMPRSFFVLPEHKVARKEKDFDWYFKTFALDKRIDKAKEFINQYKSILEQAESKNGIHYELIVSILGIETNFAEAKHKGNYLLTNALISQYLALPKRENYAVRQLTALYFFSKKTNQPASTYVGSFAGACGWGQFIPTSLLNFFVDAGNKDSNIDIFAVDDNIFSIENYLFNSGLNKNNVNTLQNRYNAVYAYNHSDSYVRGVLYMYDELRKLRTATPNITKPNDTKVPKK